MPNSLFFKSFMGKINLKPYHNSTFYNISWLSKAAKETVKPLLNIEGRDALTLMGLYQLVKKKDDILSAR